MSIYDVEDIAKWKEDNMSCMYCKHYAGLQMYCLRAVYVETGSESISCNEYEYNKEVKE